MAAPVPLVLAVLVLFGGATGSDGFALLLEVKKCVVVTAGQQAKKAPVVLRSWTAPVVLRSATSDEGGDDDLAALLEFKKGIVADQQAQGPALGSWSPPDAAAGGGRGGAAPLACPSEWRGVVCKGGAVVALALDGLHLSGELDLAPLARMRALKNLSLAGNAFSGSLPAAIGDLASFRHLDLSGNRFDGPVPDRLAGLSGLVHLKLSHNGAKPPRKMAAARRGRRPRRRRGSTVVVL